MCHCHLVKWQNRNIFTAWASPPHFIKSIFANCHKVALERKRTHSRVKSREQPCPSTTILFKYKNHNGGGRNWQIRLKMFRYKSLRGKDIQHCWKYCGREASPILLCQFGGTWSLKYVWNIWQAFYRLHQHPKPVPGIASVSLLRSNKTNKLRSLSNLAVKPAHI